MDPHGPYDPPQPFDAYYRGAPSGHTAVKKSVLHDPPWVEVPTLEGRRLLYDGEIRYNDFCFERFLNTLRETALLDTTLIVFTADHGEHLGEHELWGHHPPGYRQGLQVPLFMVCPDKLPMDRIIMHPVQLIDIMPTVLDLADIAMSDLLIEGDSLLSLIHGEELDFWDRRVSFSEEVVHKGTRDTGEWASLFYGKWHILRSHKLNDSVSQLARKFNAKDAGRFFGTRVFNFLKDEGETHYVNSFLFDLIFQYKIKQFIGTLQENNRVIWQAVTRDTKEMIRYDPSELERLKEMGYVN